MSSNRIGKNSESEMLSALRKSQAIASGAMESAKGFCLEFQHLVEELIKTTEAIDLPDPSRYTHLEKPKGQVNRCIVRVQSSSLPSSLLSTSPLSFTCPLSFTHWVPAHPVV